MAAPHAQALTLMICPACGRDIIARAAWNIELGDKIEKTIQADATLTGVQIEHNCIPKQTR